MTCLAVFLQDQEIDEEFDLLVLASDGLWDVVPNEVSLLSFSFYLSLMHRCKHIHKKGI